MRNKSFAKITVNDICKIAMVSRSTFYDLMELIQEQKQKGRLFTLNDDAIASFYAGGIARARPEDIKLAVLFY